MIENPVYAGVNPEKWTQGDAVKCQFDGLVSVKLFNAANRGKLIIAEDNEGVHIYRRRPAEHLLKKGVKNSEFPFKRIVMCPGCNRPLYGSSSRGRHGKYFPAYHCNQRDGHYFRKPKKEFDHTIEEFVKHLGVSREYIDVLVEYVGEAFDKQQMETHKDSITLDMRLIQLRNQIRLSVDKIKMVSSETTIKYLEEDITKLESEIAEITLERQTKEEQKPVDMEKIKAYVRYFLEHLDELLLHHSNPILQAKYFGVIFNDAPTYEDIVSGTPDCSILTGVNEVFKAKKSLSRLMAGEKGFVPTFSRRNR